MAVLLARFNLILALAVIAFALTASAGAYAAIPPELGANEVKAGEEAAVEVAKQYKLSDNAADLKRVREMGAKLAEAANKTAVDALYGNPTITPFEYKFDIIEDKDVNAFCVPGGHIYVYRGLLDYVQSDQELAMILAHECTHAAHHHMVYLLKKQAQIEQGQAIVLLATIASGAKASDAYNIQLGLMVLEIARVNGYGMQAERDADAGAVRYAMAAGYNPVGLLTFMERMARQPEFINWGIYRSHPLDADRVAATRRLLDKLGVPINRRAVTNAVIAQVKTEKIDGVDVPGVVISGQLIYRPAPVAGKTSAQLAQEAADRINKALDADIKMYEIKVDASAVIARGSMLITVSDEDAKLMSSTSMPVGPSAGGSAFFGKEATPMSSTPAQAAQSVATAIRNVILMQMVDTVH